MLGLSLHYCEITYIFVLLNKSFGDIVGHCLCDIINDNSNILPAAQYIVLGNPFYFSLLYFYLVLIHGQFILPKIIFIILFIYLGNYESHAVLSPF
jgi:hypothetical protein